MGRSAWRVDERGMLLAPSGAVVARLERGRIWFFDKKRGSESEVPFTIADWWALDEVDLSHDERRRGGAWGRHEG